MNDTELMQIAINEAIKGLELGDQPFGAVLVMDDKIISTGRNLVYSTFDPTAHAETITLRDAGTSIKTLSFPGNSLRFLGTLPNVPWRNYISTNKSSGLRRQKKQGEN